MNVATIRAAIAAALAGATGITSVAANRHQQLDGLPGAIVHIDTTTPVAEADLAYDLLGHVDVIVSDATGDEAWAQLDGLLSSNVVADAVRGLADTVQYTQIGTTFEIDKRRYIGFVLTFRVYG